MAISSGAAKKTVDVDGLEAVVALYAFKAASIVPLAGAVTVHYAERAAQRMRDTVPVDEGNVLDSITSDDAPTVGPEGIYADAGPDPRANKHAFIARFLEHGTVKMSPRPFVGPAGDFVADAFGDAIRDLA